MKYYIQDEKGEVVGVDELEKWAKWFETADRKIGNTKVGDIRISTVFLSIDHNYGEGPPILYETMVFGGKYDEEQERYCTKEEALDGHKRWVEKVSESEMDHSMPCKLD